MEKTPSKLRGRHTEQNSLRCTGWLQWIIQSPSAPRVSVPTDDEMAYSGDFGSGVGWEDEEEKEAEETAEEAEEEEGEVGEVDDGGYIW